jgi:hypothetical protein
VWVCQMLKQLPLIINYVSKSIYNNNHWKNAIWWGAKQLLFIFTLHFFLFLFSFLGVTKYKRICVFKSQIESWMVLSHVHYQDIKMHIKWEKTCPKLDNYCTPHVLAKLLLSNCPTIQDKSVDHKYLVPFDLVHSW